MDADGIVILLLALLAVVALWRLVAAIRRCWDGDIEDLYEDVVVRRLVFLGGAVVLLAAALLLRGPLRAGLAMLSG